MAEVLNKYPQEMDEREVYKMIKGSAKKISEAAGSVITPEAWVLYKDIDLKTGEEKTVLTVRADGEKFGTISNTFIREFIDAAGFFHGNPGSIKIISDTSKSGREFVTCEVI